LCAAVGQVVLLINCKRLAIWGFLKTNFETPSDDLKALLVKKEADFFKQFAAISRHVLRLRQVLFLDNFGEYCDACAKMLDKSSAHDKILTVQTPVSLKPEAISQDEREKYDRYIRASINKVIDTDTDYHRLVVLNEHDTEPETKIKVFVKDLVETAVAKETAVRSSIDFSNIFIGFVLFSSIPDQIYSNLDIHITTERDFSIAFASKAAIRQLHFGGSLHLQDDQRIVSKRLIEDVESVWQKCIHENNVIFLSHYYLKTDPSNPKSGAQKENIVNEVCKAIDDIVIKIKNGAVSFAPVGSTKLKHLAPKV
jgi:hypothetical protein